MRQSLDKVIIRLPDGMRDKIQKAAKLNCRTMNAEIVFHLLREFPQEAATTGAEFGDRTPVEAGNTTDQEINDDRQSI